MKSTRFIKSLSVSIAVIFFISSVSWAAPTVYTIKVSEKEGKVTQRYKGEGDRIIIHVQDAHLNSQAQFNIAKIICSLIPQLTQMGTDKENGLARIEPSALIRGHGFQDGNGVLNQRQSASKGRIPFVGIEGATREYDLKELRDVPFKEAREKVGREFVKEGKFIGSEYASMISDEAFTLFGLEDKDFEPDRSD